MRLHKNQGFTLIELLVVIAIIGILSTLAVISLTRARVLAREASAKSELRSIVSAIDLLGADTGKWPNGCPIEGVANPEAYLLSNAQAGLLTAPTVSDQGSGCTWTASDISAWDGPYVNDLTDPWGNSYYFDPDYQPYANCATEVTREVTVAIVSFGPNGVGANAYDCDDLFLEMR